jgi:hypothetical protein
MPKYIDMKLRNWDCDPRRRGGGREKKKRRRRVSLEYLKFIRVLVIESAVPRLVDVSESVSSRNEVVAIVQVGMHGIADHKHIARERARDISIRR